MMKPFESIIEKEEGCHITPRKSRILCSCFIGDKMVDIYVRFNFNEKCVSWSKMYVGHTHEDSFFDNISVYDGTDEDVNDSIKAIDDYFYYHQLYLH